MKFAAIAIVLILLISFPIVKAERTCRVTLRFFINHTVSLEEFKILTGESEKPYSSEKLNFSIQLVSERDDILYSKDFNVNYMILTDPPKFLDEKTVTFKVPCLEKSVTGLKVINKENKNVIFYLSLSEILCNKNGVCESSNGENEYNCKEDCLQQEERREVEKNIYVYVMLVSLILIVVFIIFFISKIKVVK